MRKWISSGVLVLFASVSAAQGTCAPLVEEALASTADACAELGRNQACYGNFSLTAEGRSSEFRFEQAGDTVNLVDLQALRAAPLDVEADQWGVALLAVQANLPDTLPGQNVLLVLFGDTEVTNAIEPSTALAVSGSTGVNLRERPSLEARIVSSLARGQSASAVGRLADSTWLLLRTDDGREGWAFAELVSGDEQVETLPALDPDTPIYTAPMQAFALRTGIGRSGCADAPPNGLLIQTPEGAASVQLNVNGLDVRLSSSAFIQAAPGDAMHVALLEGQAVVHAAGVTQTVPAGTMSLIALDDAGQVAGPPGYPQPYDYELLSTLPVPALARPVTVPPPLTVEEIETTLNPAPATAPSGQWSGRIGECGNLSGVTGVITIIFEEGSMTIITPDGQATLPEIEPGVYYSPEVATYRVVSPTRIEGFTPMHPPGEPVTADTPTIICDYVFEYMGP